MNTENTITTIENRENTQVNIENTDTERELKELFEQVTLLNGEETEEELNMAIAQELLQERTRQNLIKYSITTLESEQDTGKKLDKPAFVYQNEDLFSWSFNQYSTMADAVKAAVKLINATILHNGKEVIYDALSDEDAYYIDNSTNKVMLVTLS